RAARRRGVASRRPDGCGANRAAARERAAHASAASCVVGRARRCGTGGREPPLGAGELGAAAPLPRARREPGRDGGLELRIRLAGVLHREVRGPTSIGAGVPVTLRDIVSCIARKLDQAPLVQFGAVPSHPHDSPLVIADVTRLAAELKWRPRYDLDRGLDATIAWWQSELQVAAGSPT